MPGDRPVVRIVGQDPLRQQRQRHQRGRRTERQRGRGEHQPAEQDRLQRAGERRLHQQPRIAQHVPQRLAAVRAQLRVVPVVAGHPAHRRYQVADLHRAGQRTARQQQPPEHLRPAVRTAALPPQHHRAERADREPQVLLGRAQQQRRQRRRPPAPRPRPLEQQQEQRNGEPHLVEPAARGDQQRPAQPVHQCRDVQHPRPDPRVGARERPARDPAHQRDTRREQRRLAHQQHPRVVPHPVQRGEQRQHRREVVAQQREARRELVVHALQRRHRQPEVRVAAHPLVEDAQVEPAQLERGPLLQAQRQTRREAQQGQQDGTAPTGEPDPGRAVRRPDDRRLHSGGSGHGFGPVGGRQGPGPAVVPQSNRRPGPPPAERQAEPGPPRQ